MLAFPNDTTALPVSNYGLKFGRCQKCIFMFLKRGNPRCNFGINMTQKMKAHSCLSGQHTFSCSANPNQNNDDEINACYRQTYKCITVQCVEALTNTNTRCNGFTCEMLIMKVSLIKNRL